jgi:propionate CoA-transferase
VTERCVFRLINGKMTIVEVAPGIDIQRDILPLMEFVPEVAPDCKLMDPALFEEHWGGLGASFNA